MARIEWWSSSQGIQVRRHWRTESARQVLGIEVRTEWQAHQLAAAHALAPALYDVDFEQGWLQMERIEGQHLPHDWIQQRHYCEQFLWVLKRLQDIPCADVPTLSLMTRCQILQQRLQGRDATLARRHEPLLRRLSSSWPEQRLRMTTQSVMTTPYVLVHGDLHRENVILQSVSQRWVLIDWEYAHRGQALEDLAGVLADHPGSVADLEHGRGELAAALRETDHMPSLEALRVAVEWRQLLNELWTDLDRTLRKESGMLE